ncbi:predicted protein [Sclerotinia sclerotiorum 1980 UF-70]|uniref:Uncharacterized protein n=1 Tax=Sclerotinia sclerotiorum (strain ATCC 18683 / 1980 / Ss-1) TaxID=665079 RepID=A7EYE7_SCLS1|nr:predicted protein [Sclerotinia sclerotiorum 1980 UF-70]EDN94489.1 predicted protein [Sclerotinia sclerotiorum 1980 UF-70]
MRQTTGRNKKIVSTNFPSTTAEDQNYMGITIARGFDRLGVDHSLVTLSTEHELISSE